MVREVRQTKSKEQKEFRLPNYVLALLNQFQLVAWSCLAAVWSKMVAFSESIFVLPTNYLDLGPPHGSESTCLPWAHDVWDANGKAGFQEETHKWKRKFCLFPRLLRPGSSLSCWSISTLSIQTWLVGESSWCLHSLPSVGRARKSRPKRWGAC